MEPTLIIVIKKGLKFAVNPKTRTEERCFMNTIIEIAVDTSASEQIICDKTKFEVHIQDMKTGYYYIQK